MFTPSFRRGSVRRLTVLATSLALVALVASLVPAFRSSHVRAANTTVPIGPAGSTSGPFWFCDAAHSGVVCTTTITQGDSVTWQNTTSTYHTSTECDGNCGNSNPPSPIWDSGFIAPSGTFSRQFNQPGTFNYQCNIHPNQMKGQIVVLAATPTATATPTTSPSPTPSPTPAPAVGGISLDPATGVTALQSQRSSGSSGWLVAELLAGTAATSVLLGVTMWCVKRLRLP